MKDLHITNAIDLIDALLRDISKNSDEATIDRLLDIRSCMSMAIEASDAD